MSGDVGADVALTETEREALEGGCSGAGEYMCCHRAPHRTGVKNLQGETVVRKGEIVGGAMLDAVEQIVAARVEAAKAEALREAADAYTAQFGGSMGLLPDWLRDRAAALDPGPRA